MSAYMASKLAQTKIIEYLVAEQPNIFGATVHPGMVETDVFTKSGAKAEELPMDKGKVTEILILTLEHVADIKVTVYS